MQSMPLHNNLINIRANKWWCDELTSLRSRVNNLRRKYQRCQTIRRFILQQQYQCLRKAYKNRIIDLKRKCWEIFIEESTRDNPWGIIYKISRDKLNVEKINELVQSDGSLITDNESIAKTLLDKLFPEDDINNDSEIQKHIRNKANEVYSNPASDPPFEYCELEHVVKHQNPKKAPGEDGFTGEIVKNLYNAAPELLLNIYNKCLELFHFPNQWKSSVIKVIKKAGKDDYRLPNSYRPISLLSIFAKILEKLLINRIMHYLKSNNLLSEKQYGFTAQISTADALHSIKSFIEKAYNEKGFAAIITVDISGAFDNAWWPKILLTLRNKKCPQNLYNLVKSYFINRKAKLWYQNKQVVRALNIGCPQGSASGPFYWNIQYNDLLEEVLENGVEIEGFADDTIVKIRSNTIEDLELKANNAVKILSDWAKRSKLSFNASKTK
jgi:hypothetical protein